MGKSQEGKTASAKTRRPAPSVAAVQSTVMELRALSEELHARVPPRPMTSRHLAEVARWLSAELLAEDYELCFTCSTRLDHAADIIGRQRLHRSGLLHQCITCTAEGKTSSEPLL